MENWKTVTIVDGVDYTGYYEASDEGNIRSSDRIIVYRDGRERKYTGIPITQYKNKNTGYMQCVLTKNNIPKTINVHQLVMNAHNPNPNTEIYTDINHIDEDKTNNRLDNLEWTTHKENVNHGMGIEKRVESFKNRFIPVVKINIDGSIENVYYRRNDINNEEASAALNERILKGYFWIKLDKYNELTQKELMDAINIKIIRSKNSNKCKRVIQLSKNNEFIKEYDSIIDAAKEMKCTKQAIQQCASGIQKTCKGYKWKYNN